MASTAAFSCSCDFGSHYPSYYSNLACFLYPAYASYKALSISPINSQDATRQLERWLMYWAVVGSWVGMEAVAGWFLSLWVRSDPMRDHAADDAFSIPFYSLFKLAFFLWLSLPQTEGSTYLFNTLLAPTFHEHERDIDAFLSSLKTRLSGAILDLLTWAWGRARSALDVSIIDFSRSSADRPVTVEPRSHKNLDVDNRRSKAHRRGSRFPAVSPRHVRAAANAA